MSTILPREPVGWNTFTRSWCGLSEHQAYLWWRALCQSRWSLAQAFRQGLQAVGGAAGLRHPASLQAFRAEHGSPQRLCELVEALVQEGALSRRDGTAIEERLLARVGADGCWINL